MWLSLTAFRREVDLCGLGGHRVPVECGVEAFARSHGVPLGGRGIVENLANRGGQGGHVTRGNDRPVLPSMTAPPSPPTLEVTRGAPVAAASSATMPNGS